MGEVKSLVLLLLVPWGLSAQTISHATLGGTAAIGSTQLDGPALLPQNQVNANQPDTTGYTTVPVGGTAGALTSALGALNDASCTTNGTILNLTSGATYAGNFVLPNLNCSANKWIVIQTNPASYSGPAAPSTQAQAVLATRQSSSTESGLAAITTTNTSAALASTSPCANGQVNISGTAVSWVNGVAPNDSGYSAHFVAGSAWNGVPILIGNNPPVQYTIDPTSNGSTTALTLASPGAGTQTNVQYGVCSGTVFHNYWIRNVEISSTNSTGSPPNTYNIVTIGGASPYTESQLSFVPYNVIFDRDYIHGAATIDIAKAIVLNCGNCGVINSDIREIHGINTTDSNAINETNSPGPLLIDNNYLDADGENMMLGGAAPALTNLFPKDITVTRNHFIKPFTRPEERMAPWDARSVPHRTSPCAIT